MSLSATNYVKTATGFQLLSDLFTGAAIFDAISLDPNKPLKVSIPQQTLTQTEQDITMEDGTLISAMDSQELLVMADATRNQVEWRLVSAIVATDLLVKVETNAIPDLEVSAAPTNITKYSFSTMEVAAKAVGGSVTVYDLAAFGAPFGAVILQGGFIARMKGDILSTFIADDDAPAVTSPTTKTNLVATVFAPAPDWGQQGGEISIGVTINNANVGFTGRHSVRIKAGATTGVTEIEALLAGAVNCTLTRTQDGNAEETIVEVVTPV